MRSVIIRLAAWIGGRPIEEEHVVIWPRRGIDAWGNRPSYAVRLFRCRHLYIVEPEHFVAEARSRIDATAAG
jgi:hypothetical protein